MAVYLPDEQKYIDKLVEIVEENFHNSNFGVAELAKEMGISYASLNRKLKAIARQSISQFIRETRLKRALELLQLQAGTVAEVAFGVGFGSTTYFSKCFHDYYGHPPGKVRKRFVPKSDLDKSPDSAVIPNKEIESIAILPFDNFSGDQDHNFLIFGIHDALIGELGQLGSVRVISRTSVLVYTDSRKSIGEIARDLDVDAVLEASVLFIDENIRIQLKLFAVFPEEQLLWSQTFNVEISNILKLYSQAIRKIANEIHITISPVQITQIVERREVNPESYKAYLRGKYFLYQLTEEGMKLGLEHLHEAVSIDPAEPLAYAGLALGYMEIAHGSLNPGDAYIKAESAAVQALKLDVNLAEAQLALAELSMYSYWKYDEAEKYFRRAIELNPFLSIAHYHYSWLLFLLDRHEEAVFEHELAQRYDPFNPMIVGHNGILFAYLGRYEEAIREVDKSFEIQKNCPDGYFALVETYLAMGKEMKAIETSKRFVEVDPEWKWVLGYAYAATNEPQEAEYVLDELLNSDITSWIAFGIAGIYCALGDLDEASKWMTYEPHHAWVPWLSVMPMTKPVRHEARFSDFMKLWHLQVL